MPRTLNEGFEDFLKKLTPTATETLSSKKHRASIENCLRNNFGLVRFFRTGSFGNGTSISGFSDVDYFAEIPTSRLSGSSKYSLSQIRDKLNTTFYSTNVRVDDPAVVCPFGVNDRESHEIVPCCLLEKQDNFSIYNISDTTDSWMKSSPEKHNNFIRKENTRLNNKLKPLIRYIKAWKYYNNVQISSFYLELRIASIMKKEDTVIYSIDIKSIIKWLFNNDLPAIQDPMKISGYIQPCKTEIQKKDALSKLKTALSRAEKARSYEHDDDIWHAFYYWNLFFGNKFPSYYK